MAIMLSAVLGTLVTFSTFLVVAATSSLTFSVVRGGMTSCAVNLGWPAAPRDHLVDKNRRRDLPTPDSRSNAPPGTHTPSCYYAKTDRPWGIPCHTLSYLITQIAHLKTVSVVFLGVLVFHDHMSWSRAAGVGLAIAGIGW